MSQLTDEMLLKRARHASRNLGALAVLATIFAVMMLAGSLAVALLAKSQDRRVLPFLALLGLAIALIAAGYWILRAAAKRGNPTSVFIVTVVMSVQVLLGIFGFVLSTLTGQMQGANTVGVVIGILIIVALENSRKVLVELRKRGLSERVFGVPKPSQTLCTVGGALLVCGIVGIFVTGAVMVLVSVLGQPAGMNQARSFHGMITGPDQDFLATMKDFGVTGDRTKIPTLLSKIDHLQEETQAIQSLTPAGAPLLIVLSKYQEALGQWKGGISMLNDAHADIAKAQQMLQAGDGFRREALEQFDKDYNKPPSR